MTKCECECSTCTPTRLAHQYYEDYMAGKIQMKDLLALIHLCVIQPMEIKEARENGQQFQVIWAETQQ